MRRPETIVESGPVGAADARGMRELTLLVLASLLFAAIILFFMIAASLQAVDRLDDEARARELGQVDRAVAASPVPLNAITLDALSRTLDLDHARLTHAAAVRADELAVAVSPGSDQRIAWRPHLIGSRIFESVAPLRIACGLGFLLVVAAIAWRTFLVGRRLEVRRVRAARLALTDPLTGVANRLAYDEELQARCLAAADGGPGFILMSLDIDDFKSINDRFGHAAGDAALCAIAGHLRDVLGPEALVARIGGDEFAALCDGSGLDDRLAALRERLARPIVFDTHSLVVAASIGMARSEDFAGAPARLSAAADAALYRAKRSGPGNAELAVPPPAPRRYAA